MTPLFEICDLSAQYGKQIILEKLSLSLGGGTLTGILGLNGSGKTTLLKSICGILPHRGHCTFDGRDLETLSPRQLARICSYIPQRCGLSASLSLEDVVLMAFNPYLGLLEHPTASMQREARAWLEQVGLGDLSHRNFQTVSEGQKQLTLFARAMSGDSRLLLLDEPESALDYCHRYGIMEKIRSWLRPDRVAVVALHDPQLALNVCDTIYLLGIGETLSPRTDSLEKMQEKLIALYGPLRLMRWEGELVLLRKGGESRASSIGGCDTTGISQP